MIRRVAFAKAIAAGIAGAVAWELVIRLLSLLGMPLFDITKTLGTMLFPNGHLALWWPAGLTLHAMVGVIWAIFYAYFFWSTFRWAPVVQGLVFSALPALLAGFIMIPQMGWMHPMGESSAFPFPGPFAINHGWGGPVGVIIGHIVFGLVMGAIYVRPVGRRVAHG